MARRPRRKTGSGEESGSFATIASCKKAQAVTLDPIILLFVCLVPAVWDFKRIQRRYGFIPAILSAAVVAGGLYLWLTYLAAGMLFLLKAQPLAVDFVEFSAIATVPPVATWLVGRKSSLAPGIVAGVVAGVAIVLMASALKMSLFGT